MAHLPTVCALARGPVLVTTATTGLLGRAVGVGAVCVGWPAGRARDGVSGGHTAFLLLAGGTTVCVALDALELLFDLLLLECVELGVTGGLVVEEAAMAKLVLS